MSTERHLDPPPRYDFAGSVTALAMGRYDPSARLVDGAFWWATRTPDGPATLSLRRDGPRLLATGYGPGAQWVLTQADSVAGLRDDPSGFPELAAAHPLVAELARVHSGLRLPATGRVFGRLVRAILEQKVTGKQAYQSWSATVRHFSGSAPESHQPPAGAPALALPPDPIEVAATPYWVFHPFGVEQRRADTIARAALAAPRLETCPDSASLTKALTAIPGIGPWTCAEVVRDVFGDPDAVSVGDYHLPNLISWALAGQARAGARDSTPGRLSPADQRMLELLEPFRGHRARVCALLKRAGHSPPRFGPRATINPFNEF